MFYDIFDSQVKTLNDSKYCAGFIMILINIGSRFIDIKFSKNVAIIYNFCIYDDLFKDFI